MLVGGRFAGFVIGIAVVRGRSLATPCGRRAASLGAAARTGGTTVGRDSALVRAGALDGRQRQAHRPSLGRGGVHDVGDPRRDATVCPSGARARARAHTRRSRRSRSGRSDCCTARPWFRRRAAAARWSWRFAPRSPASLVRRCSRRRCCGGASTRSTSTSCSARSWPANGDSRRAEDGRKWKWTRSQLATAPSAYLNQRRRVFREVRVAHVLLDHPLRVEERAVERDRRRITSA